ncbi:MAG: GNAT family protein [Pseudomonadota bacterium]
MNSAGLPIGFPVPDWQPRPYPPRTAMEGRLCRVVPIDVDAHAGDLFDAFARDGDGRNWTYMPSGPFADRDGFRAWLAETCTGDDPLFYTVTDRALGHAVGMASYLRIDPGPGVIEVGFIHFSPLIQRSAISTECMYMMMARVFDELGYRRYEWKCDALNAPSRRAAKRLGFSFEGLFRQATIYKGRNRDTAWFSILDTEWPAIRAGFEAWLAPDNFDPDGRQKAPLNHFVPEGREIVREV